MRDWSRLQGSSQAVQTCRSRVDFMHWPPCAACPGDAAHTAAPLVVPAVSPEPLLTQKPCTTQHPPTLRRDRSDGAAAATSSAMPQALAVLTPVHLGAGFLSRVVHSTAQKGAFISSANFYPGASEIALTASHQGTAPSSLVGHCPKVGKHRLRHPGDQSGVPDSRQHKPSDGSASGQFPALHHYPHTPGLFAFPGSLQISSHTPWTQETAANTHWPHFPSCP